ncbi:hypothetical protein GMOD_00005792 [Pyrenophora seminiperda CCB06]|uniref:Uncharacterized protein n=1 Tax=Pyrenophora seminiperda CCB06 TaxID=1302712 RepID=A0A3M7MA60_9PLEO|nr:hypothetical protein GMOD_00005792 [Pyrenophora seminiperda CCB06]
MASIELRDVASPAPSYSSTSSNPYYQSTKNWPLPSTYPTESKPHVQDEEEAPVKPDYQDPNHPHFAQSTGPKYPATLPARSRMPRKRVLVPWVLFIIFFLISMWYTSILLGARFLSIIRPVPPTPPTTPEINVYINGDMFQGSVLFSTPTTVIQTSSTPTTTVTPQAPLRPTMSVPGGSNGDALPDMSDGFGKISTGRERRMVAAPTAFVTVARGGYEVPRHAG